jgi:hypothetical protein
MSTSHHMTKTGRQAALPLPVCLTLLATAFPEIARTQEFPGSTVIRALRISANRISCLSSVSCGITRANITFAQFLADRAQLISGSGLPKSTINLANNFVQPPEFKTAYPDTMTAAEFVNKLFDTANLTGPANAACANSRSTR